MKSKISKPQSKSNPAVMKSKLEASIQKRLHDAHYQGVLYSTIVMKLISYMILSDKFGFDNEQIEAFKDRANEMADSLTRDYLSVNDMLDIAREEFGIKLSTEDLCIIDPGFKPLVDDDKK